MKKLALLVTVLTCMTASLIAQPPPPPDDPGDAGGSGLNRTESPVATATLLMLGLGGAVLGYKLKSNSKREEDAE